MFVPAGNNPPPLGRSDPSNMNPRKKRRMDVITPQIGTIFTGKDGTKWEVISTADTETGRTAEQNVMRETPGPTSYAKRRIIQKEAITAFTLFVDKFIVDTIVECTQIEARSKSGDETWSTSTEEIYKLFGVMYARGLLAKGQPVDYIWSKKWGPPIFSQLMSRNRYKELIRYLRFDIRTSRSERLQSDKFCLFSVIWNRFIDNCKACYIPNADITVDEQLFPTKSRCPFTQYIASKPDKFGIKFWLAVDSKSTYLLNGFPYVGKDDHRPATQSMPAHVVMKLMEPFAGKGRNVTTDNFFTSLRLSEELKAKKTSIVGTMNRIRREIPNEVKTMKIPLYSTIVLRNQSTSLTVYQCKPSKNVLLLSTVHRNVTCADNKKKTPETIQYYNATKYGVDVLDQKARLYTTKVASRRWPLQVFYNVLDLAAINSVIVYSEVTGDKITRRDYLLKLICELGNIANPDHGDEEEETENEPGPTAVTMKRVCCQVKCLKNSRNKTSKACKQCKKPVCGKCVAHKVETVICKLCKP